MLAASPVFNPRRLGHLNMWVNDVRRSERFYNEICGLTVSFTEPGIIGSFMGTGTSHHDLAVVEVTYGEARYGRDGLLQIPPGMGLTAGLNHVAWEMENATDLLAAMERASARGIEPEALLDHQISHSYYLLDPDHNMVEFYYDTVRNWRDTLHGEMDLVTSAWDPGTATRSTETFHEETQPPRRVEHAPLHPRRLSHAVLKSTDPKRLIAFYTEIAGLRLEPESTPEVALLSSSLPGLPFCLAICADETSGYSHAAYELDDPAEFEGARQALAEKGILLSALDLPWKRALLFADPNGLMLEFFVPLEGKRDFSERHGMPLCHLA